MIPRAEFGRPRDGTRWRARIRPGSRSGLRAGELYQGLGIDSVSGYRWVEDGKWARCVAEGELELIEGGLSDRG